MKKSFFFFSLFSLLFALGSSFAASSQSLVQANALAKLGLIVSHSDDPTSYRLDDTMLRQELIGTALKLADVKLADDYNCQGYFSDANFSATSSEAWVCRAFEMGADKWFVTRANTKARPRDAVTRAEALAIVVQASGMKLYPENYTSNWLKTSGFADWQTKLLSSLADCRIYNHGVTCEDGKDGNIAMGNFRPNAPATRADVFEFMIYTDRVQNLQTADCEKFLADINASGHDDTSAMAIENIIHTCSL